MFYQGRFCLVAVLLNVIISTLTVIKFYRMESHPYMWLAITITKMWHFCCLIRELHPMLLQRMATHHYI